VLIYPTPNSANVQAETSINKETVSIAPDELLSKWKLVEKILTDRDLTPEAKVAAIRLLHSNDGVAA
jgi:hypothetical protein